jgi:hypothetical protein
MVSVMVLTSLMTGDGDVIVQGEELENGICQPIYVNNRMLTCLFGTVLQFCFGQGCRRYFIHFILITIVSVKGKIPQ